jgi:hypothetical protein
MFSKKNIRLISIVLAILLILCLLNMPYSYFEFVRFLSMVGFVLLAYYENTKKNELLKIIFICLALLFQPFFKVSLGREFWNIVDLIVAAFLIYLAMKKYK